MRGLFFTVAILASVSVINSYSLGFRDKIKCLRNADELQSRIYENEIKKTIEQIREQLKTDGIPEFGVPPLDPLILTNKRIHLENEAVNLDLNLTALANGLAGFEVIHVKMSLIGLKFEIDLHFPQITASGKYGLLAKTPLAPFQIFGNGDFNMTATNLTIQGKGKVGTKLVNGELKIILDKLDLDLNLQEIDFKITGLLDSDEVSQVVSGAISSGLPQVLKDIKDDINEALKIVIKEINDILINARGMPKLNHFTMC